jgi:polar amino acid transport system substrate-binding protein
VYSAKVLNFSAEFSYNSYINEEILKQAYERIGYKINITRYPAARSIKVANKGNADGELFRMPSVLKYYKNLRMVPTYTYKLDGRVFSKNLDFEVTGIESIKPYNIGIVRGIKFAEKITEGLNFYKVNRYNQLFHFLEKDRVQIVISSKISGNMHLSRTGITGIKMHKGSLIQIPLHHFLHKRHKKLIPEINFAILSMKKEGLIDKIVHDMTLISKPNHSITDRKLSTSIEQKNNFKQGSSNLKQ